MTLCFRSWNSPSSESFLETTELRVDEQVAYGVAVSLLVGGLSPAALEAELTKQGWSPEALLTSRVSRPTRRHARHLSERLLFPKSKMARALQKRLERVNRAVRSLRSRKSGASLGGKPLYG